MDSQESDMTTIYTFQTVKLSLETWAIVAKTMAEKNINISDALELLCRHGTIHLLEVEKRLETWQP
jgi:hypothetical protein